MLVELSLLLSCAGASSGVAATSSSSAVVYDNQGRQVTARGSTIEPVTIYGTVEIKLFDGIAEVLVPSQFTGGSGGTKWRKVKNLVVTETEITGKVGLGLLSSTTFRVDRRTGSLTSNGGFRGQCIKVDESQRAF